MRSDNSHHLLAAVQRRRQDTLERAQRTLRELTETGRRFTVTDIAAQAGVSRAWLYAQTDLREQLRQLSDPQPESRPAVDHTQRSSDASLRQRLTLAHARIHELDDENHQLRDEIAHLHGQLRASRLSSNHVADTVHDTNAQLTPLNGRSNPR
jgi:chromosome segregation ATPase